jgi:HK97 gp10 family phage protein
MAGNIRMSGDKELLQALKELDREIAGKISDEATFQGARVVAIAAQDKAPYRTGRLKESIFVSNPEKKIKKTTSYARTLEHYAIFVEFGTVHMAPQAFFRPAIDENEGRVRDEFVKSLKAGIEQATSKYRG